MKQSKSFYLFAAFVCFFSASSRAAGTQIDGIHYLLDASLRTAKVTYTGLNEATPSTYSGDVAIPDTVVYDQIAYAVTTVGKSAFLSCTGLISVSLPSTITTIEQQGFFHCTALDTLKIAALAPPSVGNYAFSNCPATMTVVIPCGSLDAYTSAPTWSGFASRFIEDCIPAVRMTFTADATRGWVFPTDTLVPIADTLMVVAVANEHYLFDSWSNGEKKDTLWIIAATDTALEATFKEQIYSVTVSSNNQTMGSVSPASAQVTYGDSILVTATPNDRYVFARWSNGVTTPQMWVVPGSDTVLQAIFAPFVYQVTAAANDSSMGTVTGSGSCAFGDSVLLTAAVKDTIKYVFQGWSNGQTKDSIWCQPTGDTTITALFAWRTYELTVVPNDSAMGAVIGSGIYEYGTTVNIYALPSARYELAQWSTGDTLLASTVTITCDTLVQALFEPIKYKVTAVADDPVKGMTTGNGKCIYGDSVLVKALVRDSVKYIFKHWSNGDTADSLWVKPEADTVVTAIFAMHPYEVQVVANDSAWGVVSGSGIYDYGTAVEVVATPNEHYAFHSWANSRKDSVMRFHLTGDTTIIAHFAPKRYKVFGTSMDHHMGYVSPAYSEVTYGQSVTLYAYPTDTARYWFEKWSTGETLPSIVVTPSSDTTLTTYWRNIYTVTFSSIIGEKIPEQKIVDGYLSTEPKTPKQEPYKFMGWYTTDACETLFDFNGPIVHDTTLFASWVIYTEMWDTAVCSYEWLDAQQGDTLIFDSGDYSRRYATPTLDSIHTKHLIVYTPSTDNDLANLAPEIIPMYQRWNIVLDVTSFTSILEGLGGVMVPADQVHWYKVVGEPDKLDNSGVPAGDDIPAVPFTGYYHTEGAPMSGDYYAVIFIEHFEGQTCSATFRTNIVSMNPSSAIERNGEESVGYDVLGRRVGQGYRGYVIYADGTKIIKM